MGLDEIIVIGRTAFCRSAQELKKGFRSAALFAVGFAGGIPCPALGQVAHQDLMAEDVGVEAELA